MNEHADEECLEDECQMECDGWDARYCCTLCMWYDDEPDCSNCNPMDV